MSDNNKQQVTASQAIEMLKNGLGLSETEIAELDADLLNELAADMGVEIIPDPVEEVVEEQPVTKEAAEEETTTEQAEEEPATEQTEEIQSEEQPEVQTDKATEEPAEEVAEQPATTEERAEEETTTEQAEEVQSEEQPEAQSEEVTEEPAEEAVEQPAPAEEAAKEEPATTEAPAETPVEAEVTAVEVPTKEEQSTAAPEEPAPAAPKKEVFKLTAPENNDELLALMCTKRGRKLIYAPKEVLYEHTFTVLGTDKKNDEGIKVKDIIDAEIKAGEKLGYLQKYDGLKTSEIKEEYENDVVYEYAEQEFKKSGLIYDGKKIKVYLYDWDGKACHHVGYIDEKEAAGAIPYLSDKDNYSFGLNAIITGGKGKRVIKDEKGKITIEKIKDGVVGLELDVNVLKRKD